MIYIRPLGSTSYWMEIKSSAMVKHPRVLLALYEVKINDIVYYEYSEEFDKMLTWEIMKKNNE